MLDGVALSAWNTQFHFISLLFFQILENKLEYKYTADQIIDSMKKMNLALLDGCGYIPSYTRKDITDDFHKLFGFRTDYQITKKAENEEHHTKDKNTIIRNNEKKWLKTFILELWTTLFLF